MYPDAECASLSGAFHLGSCLLSSTNIQPQTADGQSVVATVGLIFSIALGIYTIKRMTKKK